MRLISPKLAVKGQHFKTNLDGPRIVRNVVRERSVHRHCIENNIKIQSTCSPALIIQKCNLYNKQKINENDTIYAAYRAPGWISKDEVRVVNLPQHLLYLGFSST